MTMKRRVWVLPISAIIIAGLCAYKLTRPDKVIDSNREIAIIRPAPLFTLHNDQKPPRITKLKGYIGRHKIVLVFFDPKQGLAENPVLVWLRTHADALRRQDVEVFAISPALPQAHRKMLADWLHENERRPFQMLSDIFGTAQQLYGKPGGQSQRDPLTPLEAVFLIDRAGNLRWNKQHPIPLPDAISALEREFL